jgi:membrane associated rhomboid family serine protease
MLRESPITLILIVVNVIFSLKGFSDSAFFNKYLFQVGKILNGKEYYRLVSSGFLHGSYPHLFMNMLSLYFMGSILEAFYVVEYGSLGYALYLLVYFGSMLGGDGLALLMQRHNLSYSAIGASGAISGVVFALVVFNPSATVLLFMIIPMPFWIYALAFVAYSLLGVRTRWGNIGHEAHLGGAVLGLLMGCLVAYRYALVNWAFILILAVPTITLLYLMYRDPNFAADPMAWFKSFPTFGFKRRGPRRTENEFFNSPYNPYNAPVKRDGLEYNYQLALEKELNGLLDRVSKKGYNNLSPAEKNRLHEIGQLLNRNTDMSGGHASDNP